MRFSKQAIQHFVLIAPHTTLALSKGRQYAKEARFLQGQAYRSFCWSPDVLKKDADCEAHDTEVLKGVPLGDSKKASFDENLLEFCTLDQGVLSTGEDHEPSTIEYYYVPTDQEFNDSNSCHVLGDLSQELLPWKSTFAPYDRFQQAWSWTVGAEYNAIEEIAYNPHHQVYQGLTGDSHRAYGGWSEVSEYTEEATSSDVKDSEGYWTYDDDLASSQGRGLQYTYPCYEVEGFEGTTWEVPIDYSIDQLRDLVSKCYSNHSHCPEGKPIACWDISNIHDMTDLFKDAYVPYTVGYWNISHVTSMRRTFFNAELGASFYRWSTPNLEDLHSAFEGSSGSIDGIYPWDVSRVTSMKNLFRDSEGSFLSSNLQYWDTGNVLDMSYMFAGRYDVPSGIETFNVTKVTNMSHMFAGYISIPDISDWDVTKVTDMSGLFKNSTPHYSIFNGWDCSNVQNMHGMFRGTMLPDSIANMTISSVTDMRYMFAGETFPTTVPDISEWDVTKITDMSGLFQKSTPHYNIFNGWDFSNVQNMHGMFKETSGLPDSLINMTISSVTDMRYMFAGEGYTTVYVPDISEWDVTKITDMSGLFKKSNPHYNIFNGWDFSNVQKMNRMFKDSTGLPESIANMTTSSVTDMRYTFAGENYRTNVPDISEWDVTKVTDMTGLFKNSNPHHNIFNGWDFSNVQKMNRMFVDSTGLPESIANMTTSSVTDMRYMFAGEAYITYVPDISEWDVTKVTDMSGLFQKSNPHYNIFNGWDFSNVEKMNRMFHKVGMAPNSVANMDVRSVADMSYMFAGEGYYYVNVPDISGWNVTKVTDMSGMFQKSIPYSVSFNNWDVSNVKTMKSMFKDIPFGLPTTITDMNVSSVTDMSYMFSGSFDPLPDISGWDVTKVTAMGGIFMSAKPHYNIFNGWDFSNVKNLHRMFKFVNNIPASVANMNVSSVTDMSQIFYGALGGSSAGQEYAFPDISGWTFSNVKYMSGMFASLPRLPNSIADMDVSQVIDMSEMFLNVRSSLESVSGWDVSKVRNMTGMFRKTYRPPVNIGRWDVGKVTTMRSMFEESSFSDGVFDMSAWNLRHDVEMTRMFRYTSVGLSGYKRKLCPYLQYKYPGVYDCHCSGPKEVLTTFQELQTALEEQKDWEEFMQTIGCFDVKAIDDFSSLFSNFGEHPIPQGIWGWDVSHVTSMANIFHSATFDGPIGIKNWDFTSLVDADAMFLDAIFTEGSFQTVDISRMKSKSITMENMFSSLDPSMAPIDETFGGSGAEIKSWTDRQVWNLSPFLKYLRRTSRCPAPP